MNEIQLQKSLFIIKSEPVKSAILLRNFNKRILQKWYEYEIQCVFIDLDDKNEFKRLSKNKKKMKRKN